MTGEGMIETFRNDGHGGLSPFFLPPLVGGSEREGVF